MTATPQRPTPSTLPPINPHAPLYPTPGGSTHPGISYHDWLAAIAMQAFVTHGMEVRADRAMTEEDKDRALARRAYQMADAMLHARRESGATAAR